MRHFCCRDAALLSTKWHKAWEHFLPRPRVSDTAADPGPGPAADRNVPILVRYTITPVPTLVRISYRMFMGGKAAERIEAAVCQWQTLYTTLNMQLNLTAVHMPWHYTYAAINFHSLSSEEIGRILIRTSGRPPYSRNVASKFNSQPCRYLNDSYQVPAFLTNRNMTERRGATFSPASISHACQSFSARYTDRDKRESRVAFRRIPQEQIFIKDRYSQVDIPQEQIFIKDRYSSIKNRYSSRIDIPQEQIFIKDRSSRTDIHQG
ncbi:hypothetical protein J6590_043969 [Homalodisca vitripennis]|nr:hypothetical protein J6590_043969 [Homalodisca vitripennis]